MIRWRLAEVSTLRVVKFELDPLTNEKKYEIEREWLYREGTGVYELIVMPEPPENYANISNEEIWEEYDIISYPIDPLCSYYVRDKDLYKYEKSYRRTMRLYSLAIIGLTIVNLIFLYGPQLIGLIKGVLNCQ